MKGKITIEKASSGRSHCVKCEKLIDKDTYRVVETYRTNFVRKDKYCAECGLDHLSSIISELFGMVNIVKGE
jgi:hypothetical protein